MIVSPQGPAMSVQGQEDSMDVVALLVLYECGDLRARPHPAAATNPTSSELGGSPACFRPESLQSLAGDIISLTIGDA